MKSSYRALVLCVTLALSIMLVGCAQPDEATQKVIDNINNIGEVTLNSGAKIKQAQTAYDALSEEQKKMVNNYQTLENATGEFSEIKIANCIELIDAIGEPTLESETAYNDAKQAYDSLSILEKQKITNEEHYLSAQEKIDALIKEDEIDKVKKQLIENKQWEFTDTIGAVTIGKTMDTITWTWKFFEDNTYEEKCSNLLDHGTYSIEPSNRKNGYVVLHNRYSDEPDKAYYTWITGDKLKVDFAPVKRAK